MAYFRNLARRCADCPSPATVAVFDCRDVLVGEYCGPCGARRLFALNRDEREAEERTKVVSNG